MRASRYTMMNHKIALLTFITIISSSLLISGCGKSEVDICIDKQSHLWDNKTNDKSANKAYWDAVAQCRQSNK